MAMSVEQMEEVVAKLEDGFTVMEKRAQKAELQVEIASLMNPEEREIFKSFTTEEQGRVLKKLRKGKISKLLTEAKEKISKAKEPSEEIKKQMVDFQKRLDESDRKVQAAEAIAKKAQDNADLLELTKTAREKFDNLPGTPEEKAKILKSLKVLPKEDQEGVLKLLEAGNKAGSTLFMEIGKSATIAGGGAHEQLDGIAKSMVAENISKGDKTLTYAQAYDKALEMHPELYSRYLDENRIQRIGGPGSMQS